MAQPQVIPVAAPAQAALPNIYEQTAAQIGAPSFMDKLMMISGNPTNDPRIRRLRELEAQAQPPAGVQPPITTGPQFPGIPDFGGGFQAYIKKLQDDFNSIRPRDDQIEQQLKDAGVGAPPAGVPVPQQQVVTPQSLNFTGQ